MNDHSVKSIYSLRHVIYNSRVAGRVDVLETQQTKILRLSPPLFDHPINKQTIIIQNYDSLKNFSWYGGSCPKIVIKHGVGNISNLDHDSCLGFQP